MLTAASAGSTTPLPDQPAHVDGAQHGAAGARRALPPFESGAARYCYLLAPQDKRSSPDLSDQQGVPALAPTAHPDTPARQAGNPYEGATERQASRKEARGPHTQPSEPAPTRLPRTTSHRTRRPPAGSKPSRHRLCPPHPPTEELLMALGATRASNV